MTPNRPSGERMTNRRAVLAALGSAAMAGCATEAVPGFGREAVDALACDASGGWRQFQADPGNTGRTSVSPPSFDAGAEVLVDGIRNGAAAPGVVADDRGRVFAPDGTTVLGYDSRGGTEQWRRSLDAPVAGTPVLACEGVIVATITGTVALSADDGTVLWEQSVGASGPPVVDGETIYLPGGVTSALEVASGAKRWTTEFDDVSVRACCLAGGTLVVVGKTEAGGMVMGLDPGTGEERWRTDARNQISAAPTHHDGTIYVPDEGNQVYAVDAETGDVRWRVTAYGDYPGDRLGSAPAVTESTVVVPSGNGGTTVGLDRETGDRRWELETAQVLGSPIPTENGVVIGSINQGLYRVSESGEVTGRATDTRAGGPMALTEAGLFYKTAGPGNRADISFIPTTNTVTGGRSSTSRTTITATGSQGTASGTAGSATRPAARFR